MVFENRKGIALLIVLWVMALMAVVAASFTTETRTESKLARNLVENAKAEALADAGVYRAVMALIEQGRAAETSLEMEEPSGEGQAPAAAGGGEGAAPLRADGTVYAWSFGEGRVRISVQDEAGKIDLNAAPDELLEGLFLALGADEEEAAALVHAIGDFRDGDDLRRLDGAEDADYAAAGLAYGAKDAPFEAVEELKLVMGMTPELYEKAAPFLTVHSGLAGIDPVFAPREVLLALPGVPEDEADSLIAARDESREAVEAWFRQYTVVEPFVVASDGLTYGIRAEARTFTGAVFVREAVVEFAEETDDPPFRFLAWRRGLKPEPAGAGVAGEGGP